MYFEGHISYVQENNGNILLRLKQAVIIKTCFLIVEEKPVKNFIIGSKKLQYHIILSLKLFNINKLHIVDFSIGFEKQAKSFLVELIGTVDKI